MSDFLVELGQNRQARNLIKSLGLPIPMPAKLARQKGPEEERPLHDKDVTVFCSSASQVGPALARALCEAGANPFLSDESAMTHFQAPGEAFGRPAHVLDLTGDEFYLRPHAMVVDATT
ncbi:MAG: short chain dehydrogenase, partial [Myxococcales bacterium]|nr:short chain dehydrogenase [Myxococcales bacterium]